MKNEWNVSYIANFFHFLETKVWFAKVWSMYRTKRWSQSVDSSFFNDAYTFVAISILNTADYVILLSANCTYFCFNGYTFSMCIVNNFLRHFNVLINWVMGTIDHNGSKASIDSFFTFVKA
ncbi:hypothetical protein D3C80_1649690 [compost metagenome]